MSLLLGKIATFFCTLGPVGYIPFAPGTFGSLVALLIVMTAKPGLPLHAIISAVSLGLGIYFSGHAARVLGGNDPGRIVIDEFAGMLAATLFLPNTPGWMIAAFILFRVFDILKPPPIKAIEGLGGGMGIMLDDIAAGLYANIALQIIKRFL